MSIIKPAIFRTPFTAVKGRYTEIPFTFYESFNSKTQTGVIRDLTGLAFSADFRYDVDDVFPIFNLNSGSSPASILVEPTQGRVTLRIDSEASQLVVIPVSKSMELPIRRVLFELRTLYPDQRNLTAALGSVNFYQNITRTLGEDGVDYVTYLGEYVTYNGNPIIV